MLSTRRLLLLLHHCDKKNERLGEELSCVAEIKRKLQSEAFNLLNGDRLSIQTEAFSLVDSCIIQMRKEIIAMMIAQEKRLKSFF